jgi:ABC-type lipoprotein export system ATPase subunit
VQKVYFSTLFSGENNVSQCSERLLNDPELILADEPTILRSKLTEVIKVLKPRQRGKKLLLWLLRDYAFVNGVPTKTMKCEDVKF